MALQNLSGVYNGGATVFNQQPHVQFYAQLLAREQAKKDALDQYYQKSLTDVTPAGMRNKDVTEGWAKKVSDWQEFGMNPQNRKYLLNPRLDNYKTVTQFNQMHQDLLNDAEKSKQELKDETFVNQHRLSGKWNPTDEDLQLLHRKGLSIYDSKRINEHGEEPDLTNLSFNDPEFTPLQETQLYKSATQGILPKNKVPDETKRRIDNQTGMVYTPYSQSFDKDQIKTIADLYSSNLTKSALSHYETIMKDPVQYQTATKAYQSVYGTNDIIDSPQKMAKGIAALHALAEVQTGEDKAVDPVLRQKYALDRIRLAGNLRLLNSKQLIDYRDDAIATKDNAWFDAYIDSIGREAEGGTPVLFSGGKGREYKLSVDPIMQSAIKIDGKTVDDITKTSDGNYRLLFYKTDDNGNKTNEVDDKKSRVISRDQFKLNLGYKPLTKKQLSVEMGKQSQQGKTKLNW